MFEKFKNIIIIILLSALMIIQIISNLKENKIQKLQSENFQLNDKLQSIIKIQNNKIKIIYKDKEKIKYVNIYVPPESPSTTITTDNDGKISIDYSKFGAGLYPFVGLGYTNKVKPILGTRLIYWNRFGFGVSTTFDGVSLFGDVRTDLQFLKNSSLGLFYDNNKNLGVGVHTFL